MADSKIYVKGEELFKVFNSLPWDDLYIRLEAYIFNTLRYKYGVVKSNEQLKSKAHEIISEVMDLIFVTGTRNWCKESCPEFNTFIFGVVQSHIYDSFKTKNRTNVNTLETIEEGNKTQDSFQDTISNDDLRVIVFNELKNLNADDDELLVFDCMADGIIKPDKIRKELGIEASLLNNILRRLNRKTSKIKIKLFNK